MYQVLAKIYVRFVYYGITLKSSPFFCYQLMVSGVSGSRGLNAHDLVAVEYKRELARVIIPAPPMEEVIASVAQTRLGLATVTSAQVESHFKDKFLIF